MATVEGLPFELLSEILHHTAALNASSPDFVTYTYGLTQAHQPLHQKPHIQKYVRGHVPTDVLRWNSVSAIRQVNSRWHSWALSHALKELYIRRWQGGETWMKKTLDHSVPADILPAVYQDPYKSIHSTAQLFHDFPVLAQHVRRIWFNGIYRLEATPHIFAILLHCSSLRTISLPWTTLRYGNLKDWHNILTCPLLTSLELLSVGLKHELVTNPHSHIDTRIISTNSLPFSQLTRLKIFGDTNLSPLCDADLVDISHAATNLQEILIANVSRITAAGVAALISASRDTLKLLDYTPLSSSGFSHPPPAAASIPPSGPHMCELIAGCPRLQDLTVTLPTCCSALFSASLPLRETLRLRVTTPPTDGQGLKELLDAARGMKVEVEISMGGWLFETAAKRVHGGFREERWEGLLEVGESGESKKGPYGYTGFYGDKGEWRVVGEEGFLEVLGRVRI